MRTMVFVSAALIAGFAATSGAQQSIKLSDVAGKWAVNGRPGNDTVVVHSVVVATANPKTWTLTYPNRDPLPHANRGLRGRQHRHRSGPVPQHAEEGPDRYGPP